MMRIFGAVLIVSGGYTVGWIRVRRMQRRLAILSEIHLAIKGYSSALKKERRSLEESLAQYETVSEILLNGKDHPDLSAEDKEMMRIFADRLKAASYQQALLVVDEFLGRLKDLTNKLQEVTASQGKAFPLLTGAIGFLIAVLLY